MTDQAPIHGFEIHDMLQINHYLRNFVAFHADDCKDDMIFPVYHVMIISKKIEKSTSRMAWSAILFGDLVHDAGLLHPDLVADFLTFRNKVVGATVPNKIDDAFCDFVRSQVGKRYPKHYKWFIAVLAVVSQHFHSFLVQPTTPNPTHESIIPFTFKDTSQLILQRRFKERSVRVLRTNSTRGVIRKLLNYVPDYRLCFLLDFQCEHHEGWISEIAGVVQPRLNWRSSSPGCGFRFPHPCFFTWYEKQLKKRLMREIDERTYIFSGRRSMIFFAVKDKKPGDKIPSEAQCERMSIDPEADGLYEDGCSRFATSISVEEALKFATLWCTECGCKKMLVERDYILEVQENAEVRFTLRKLGGEPVALSDDDPSTVFDILLVGLEGCSINWVLNRRTVGLMQRDMLASYMKTKYKFDPDDEVLMCYFAQADIGHPSNRTTYLTDKNGMIWLINLAVHKVRIGIAGGDGRVQLTALLMALCGCRLGKEKRGTSSSYKSRENEVLQYYVRDGVFHESNGCHPTGAYVSSQASLHKCLRNEKDDEEAYDPNKFDLDS